MEEYLVTEEEGNYCYGVEAEEEESSRVNDDEEEEEEEDDDENMGGGEGEDDYGHCNDGGGGGYNDNGDDCAENNVIDDDDDNNNGGGDDDGEEDNDYGGEGDDDDDDDNSSGGEEGEGGVDVIDSRSWVNSNSSGESSSQAQSGGKRRRNNNNNRKRNKNKNWNNKNNYNKNNNNSSWNNNNNSWHNNNSNNNNNNSWKNNKNSNNNNNAKNNNNNNKSNNNNNYNNNNNKNNNNNYNNNNNNNNNKKNEPPVFFGLPGGQKSDLFKTIHQIYRSCSVKRVYQPLNSWVLILHYRFGSVFFLIASLIVFYNWYVKNDIVCVSSYNAESSVREYIVNICKSYSYYVLPSGKIKHILFYRWVPFSFMALSAFFYFPRIFMKKFGSIRVRNLFHYLSSQSPQMIPKSPDEVVQTVVGYMQSNLGTHTKIYYSFLFNHILATTISLGGFYFMDLVLQGEFVTLGVKTYPFARNISKFSDPLLVRFPPFTTCSITPATHMLNERAELFFCHLTLMELYEKLFVFAWVYLVLSIFCGMFSILVLFLLRLPLVSTLLLFTSRRNGLTLKEREDLLKRCGFEEIFVIYLVKKLVNEEQFSGILREFNDVVSSWNSKYRESGQGSGYKVHAI